jgi:hypothetical protein
MRPRILLYEAGVGLIIPHPTGVIYQTQAGGTCCLQPELEGASVPFDGEQVNEALYAWFTRPTYGDSGPTRGIYAEDADRIDEVLRAWRPTGLPVTVDRARLDESVEAWVHVVIHGDESPPPSLFSGFGPYPRPAVLTWTNSA